MSNGDISDWEKISEWGSREGGLEELISIIRNKVMAWSDENTFSRNFLSSNSERTLAHNLISYDYGNFSSLQRYVPGDTEIVLNPFLLLRAYFERKKIFEATKSLGGLVKNKEDLFDVDIWDMDSIHLYVPGDTKEEVPSIKRYLRVVFDTEENKLYSETKCPEFECLRSEGAQLAEVSRNISIEKNLRSYLAMLRDLYLVSLDSGFTHLVFGIERKDFDFYNRFSNSGVRKLRDCEYDSVKDACIVAWDLNEPVSNWFQDRILKKRN